jgi:hypothetical protein
MIGDVLEEFWATFNPVTDVKTHSAQNRLTPFY